MSVLQAGMQKDILVSLTRLSDAELVMRLKGFVARERDATAEIVAHLAEMDTRDVHLREGYPSMFVYCRDALGLSEDEAYNRIEVARAARRFPVILNMLAEAAVNLTAVRLLAPHLTPDNHLLVDLAKKKFADTRKPYRSPGTKQGSRHVPAEVKRAVWLRDLGRCAFIGTSGHRCNERRFVEFHHLDPHVLGGEATVERIALLCRRHNDYEGRLYFGKRIPTDDGGFVREEMAPYGSRPLDAPRTCSGTSSSPRSQPPVSPPEVTTDT